MTTRIVTVYVPPVQRLRPPARPGRGRRLTHGWLLMCVYNNMRLFNGSVRGTTILGVLSSRRSRVGRRPRESIIIQAINVPSYLLPHPRSRSVVGPLPSPRGGMAAAYNHSKTPLPIRPQRTRDSDAAAALSLDRKQKPNGRQERRGEQRGGRHARAIE